MAVDLSQRTALVTGAGQGIGKAIAERLSERVGTLVLVDRDGDSIRQVAQAVGGNARPVECDITDTERFVAALATAGPIDVLVNNAGATPHTPFLKLSAEDCARVIELNLSAVLTACREVLPGMINRGFGRVISIASDAARIGMPQEAVYSGAKAGVIGFSKALAAEVAYNGISVNVVCPGSTETPLLHSLYDEEQLQRRRARHPSGRLAQPSDIAEVVEFFAVSDGYVNGQVLSVNGAATRLG